MSLVPAHAPDGRWGGRLTERELPDGADELREMDPALREELARLWWMQAATEGRVAVSFAIVHDALVHLEADPGLVRLARRAIDDEHRHAGLCARVASQLAGGAMPPVPMLPSTRPLHDAAKSDRERAALYVLGQCALNETFANGYLGLAHRECQSPLARAAIRELMQDEIDHARLGWAYAAGLPADLRAAVSDWLVPLTVTNLREWRKASFSSSTTLERHGVPRTEALRACLDELVRELLIPGFAHAGLDVRALERWVKQGLPT